MQILPAVELSGFIKHYLFLETKPAEIKKLRLFSDGNTGLVFSFKNKLISQYSSLDNPGYLPDSFVYGQISSFKDLYCQGETSLMIVVFHAYGINRLSGISSDELKNQIFTVADLFGQGALELMEKLQEQSGIQYRITLAEDFFRKLIAKKPVLQLPVIHAAIDYMVAQQGIVTVKQLTEFTGYQERKLERLFNETIGISPNKFSHITKLHVFLKQLKSRASQTKIADLGYASGYYDQPHLIREFKKYTGLTPTQYLNNAAALAVNFLEFH